MWDAVDLKQRRIVFRHTKERKPRTARIGADLVPVLFALPSKPGPGERPDRRPVFLDERGRPVKPDRAYRRFKAAAVRAGVPDASRLRFHDLRHSCGTTLIEMGVEIHDVKEILGHHSVVMTERYIHAKRDRLRAAVARLSGTLQTQSTPDGASGPSSN